MKKLRPQKRLPDFAMETGLTRIEAYRSVRQRLKDHSIAEADREARLIISRAIGCDISGIFLYSGMRLTGRETAKANRFLERRLTGMPLQYALKTAYFMGFEFYVDHRVLIPRQETELLVEHTLKRLKYGKKSVLDLCMGSGCIAVSLAVLNRDVHISASDQYNSVIPVAKRNARKNGVENRIVFIKSDLFKNITGRFDIIVSNPPYIGKNEYEMLEKHIRYYEPLSALLAGEEGLEFYRLIAEQAKGYLNSNGEILLEIGCNQAKDVAALLKKNGFHDIACIKDYSNNDRIITAKN